MKTLSFFLAAALLVVFLGCQEADPVAPIVVKPESTQIQKGLRITDTITLPDGRTAVVSAQVDYGFAKASLNKKLPVAESKAFDLSLEIRGKVTVGDKALGKDYLGEPISWQFAGRSVDRVFIGETVSIEKVYNFDGKEQGYFLHIEFKIGEMSVAYAGMHTSAAEID